MPCRTASESAESNAKQDHFETREEDKVVITSRASTRIVSNMVNKKQQDTLKAIKKEHEDMEQQLKKKSIANSRAQAKAKAAEDAEVKRLAKVKKELEAIQKQSERKAARAEQLLQKALAENNKLKKDNEALQLTEAQQVSISNH